MDEALKIETRSEGDVTMVSVSGIIDEDAGILESAFGELSGKVTMDLEHVTRINSCGVREWIKALGTRDGAVDITYVRCAVPIIDQANMVTNFLGGGKVHSFFAPYVCPKDNRDYTVLLEVGDLDGDDLQPPDRNCPDHPDIAMEFGDDEDEYFMFIEAQLGGES